MAFAFPVTLHRTTICLKKKIVVVLPKTPTQQGLQLLLFLLQEDFSTLEITGESKERSATAHTSISQF